MIHLIKRKTNNTYYRGGAPLKKEKRWGTFSQAKYYRKISHARNAITLMCDRFDDLYEEFFEIEHYELVKKNEHCS